MELYYNKEFDALEIDLPFGHFLARKLTEFDIPKEFKYLYYIDIKRFDAHKHGWDNQTLDICLSYLNNNLKDGENVSLIPFENYIALDTTKSNFYLEYKKNAKRFEIDISDKIDRGKIYKLMEIFEPIELIEGSYVCHRDNKQKNEIIIIK